MVKRFQNLPISIQEIITQKLGRWGINGETFYETPEKFPEGFEDADLSTQLAFLDKKEVSHIKPRSDFPDNTSDIDNVIWEDIAENRSRSNNIMTPSEKQAALLDNEQDLNDLDFDDDGIIDVENALRQADEDGLLDEVMGAALPAGMILLTGLAILSQVRKRQIRLNEAPKVFFLKEGKRTIKRAVVGTSIVSGSPIVVTGSVSYILYRNKNSIQKAYNAVYKGVTSQKTIDALKVGKNVITKTAITSAKGISFTGKKLFKLTTHKNTISAFKKTGRVSYQAGKKISGGLIKGFKILSKTVIKKKS